MKSPAPPTPKRQWSLNSRATRGLLFQLLALVLIALGIWFLAHNTQRNMAARGIQSGFDFLGSAAGFDIGETMIAYDPSESYGKAIWVGVLNTLKVAALGILFTTILGVLLGVGRFSRNALVRGICYGYVETFRNVPILLQLLMWYLVFIDILPPSNEAWNLHDLFFLSKGGFSFPYPTAGLGAVTAGAAVGLVGVWLWLRHVQKRFEATGRDGDRLWTSIAIVVACAVGGWAVSGAPMQWNLPEQLAFMVDGGVSATPEFMTILVGLVMYTSAFVAEVVRSGIQSVSRGQDEAAAALGLSPRQKMKLVVLPQAMRVIVPPLTNQYLNLTKNSSLAVAIGYPDVVSIANTTINQSGRAVECIAIIMLVYLTTSLSTSLLMNWYNQRVAIKER
ncbi:amino acid ABC transporter permease [Hydrogenophaga sp.]|uniref:amino acid ABC transporter permease n=1 Tax=Hydrogenophaga sp. TaxID=1904254 RepID=UPI0027319E7A|nr:ABC transporter permease subunit [Hydrogenophaga sp.]MDP1684854.1 ABC transporter permease subunit [Hydrogenophaga sp.]